MRQIQHPFGTPSDQDIQSGLHEHEISQSGLREIERVRFELPSPARSLQCFTPALKTSMPSSRISPFLPVLDATLGHTRSQHRGDSSMFARRGVGGGSQRELRNEGITQG